MQCRPVAASYRSLDLLAVRCGGVQCSALLQRSEMHCLVVKEDVAFCTCTLSYTHIVMTVAVALTQCCAASLWPTVRQCTGLLTC